MKNTILLLCVVLTGCSMFGIEEQEPSYNAKIAWDSGLFSNSYKSHTVDEDSVYFYERPPGYTTVNIYSLTKLEADTGKLLWRSRVFSNIVLCQPVAIENHVFVFLEPRFIYAFDKETGELVATVEIKIEGTEFEFGWNISSYKEFIYTGLFRGSCSFVRFNVNNINYNLPPETVQILSPEILWNPETDRFVTAKPVVHNNIVYASTYTSVSTPVELAGFDTVSGQMVFHKTFGGPEDKQEIIKFPETGGGINSNPIFIHDNILYYLNASITAWNLSSGDAVYRHVFTHDMPNSKMHLADGSLQAVYHNGKIYYSSGTSDTPHGYRNIHCINAVTGRLVWNDIAKDSESLETNPVIAHGKLYISQYSGLRVYNPDNGKLIGVDKSFCGMGMGRNVLYKDYMICVRMDRNTGEGRLVAVYVGK